MAEYDYGNARLRAMKARLFSPAQLEALLESPNLTALITALIETSYGPAIEAALVRLRGVDCLHAAFRQDALETLGKLARFYRDDSGEEDAAELLALALRRYDVHNVKTILRGLAGQLPADAILPLTLPVGDLRAPDLAALAGAANVHTAVNLLATWLLPLAQPLLKLRAQTPDAGLFAMELALERWYWRLALTAAPQERVWSAVQQREVDCLNLLTALRLAGRAEIDAALRALPGATGQNGRGDPVAALFVGPGQLDPALLVQAARQETVAAAVALLAQTPYAAALAEGLAAFEVNGRLTSFERALLRDQLAYARQLFVRDPLGIGVALGYLTLKQNELTNLRLIAQGLRLEEKRELILRRLIL
jgi:V/A-type H+/Na+-transporting ATPase subunit C